VRHRRGRRTTAPVLDARWWSHNVAVLDFDLLATPFLNPAGAGRDEQLLRDAVA